MYNNPLPKEVRKEVFSNPFGTRLIVSDCVCVCRTFTERFVRSTATQLDRIEWSKSVAEEPAMSESSQTVPRKKRDWAVVGVFAILALFAAIVVTLIFLRPAKAQELRMPAPPSAATSASAPAAACTPTSNPPCYLHGAHLDYLQAQILALSAAAAADAARSTVTTNNNTETNTAINQNTAATRGVTDAVNKNTTVAEETRDAVTGLRGDLRNGSPSNWQWSFGATASGFAILQTGEDSTPFITRGEFVARVVSPESHIGFEAGGGAGPWFVLDNSALAVGGHAAVLVPSMDMFALLLGADLNHLQSSEEGDPGILVSTVFLSPEIHGENFAARLIAGAVAKSEDSRTSGLILGLGISGFLPWEPEAPAAATDVKVDLFE